MPITFALICPVFLGLLLFLPAGLVALILLVRKKRLWALLVLCVPLGVIATVVFLGAAIFVHGEVHNRIMSARPSRVFETTFGFKPDSQTEMLGAYYSAGLDSTTTIMAFRTTPEVIERITSSRFTPSKREVFIAACGGSNNKFLQRVASWLMPAVKQADRFYVAKPFDRCFATHNEAVLCYNTETGVACFHWAGID